MAAASFAVEMVGDHVGQIARRQGLGGAFDGDALNARSVGPFQAIACGLTPDPGRIKKGAGTRLRRAHQQDTGSVPGNAFEQIAKGDRCAFHHDLLAQQHVLLGVGEGRSS